VDRSGIRIAAGHRLKLAASRRLRRPSLVETRTAGRWTEAVPAAPYTIAEPVALGSAHFAAARSLEPSLPALGVAELEGASVQGAFGWVFDRSERLLADLSWYGRHYEEMWSH
jgi:hypothetical protein